MGGFFEGWYYKQQTNEHIFAVIPALHQDEHGQKSGSIQIITDTFSCNLVYPAQVCRFRRNQPKCIIGQNYFSDKGLRLNINQNGVTLRGTLVFGAPVRPRYDIMGPFAAVPFMQCRHKVYSLRHSVNGRVEINGKPLVFANGIGYLEGDCGASFPQHYLWTQCLLDGGGSVMLSVASIPFLNGTFEGIIGIVYLHGHEYRIATYCGAKVAAVSSGKAVVRQGALCFTAELLACEAHPLQAPVNGNMSRIIHESAACRVHYLLTRGSETLLDITADNAAFEFEA